MVFWLEQTSHLLVHFFTTALTVSIFTINPWTTLGYIWILTFPFLFLTSVWSHYSFMATVLGTTMGIGFWLFNYRRFPKAALLRSVPFITLQDVDDHPVNESDSKSAGAGPDMRLSWSNMIVMASVIGFPLMMSGVALLIERDTPVTADLQHWALGLGITLLTIGFLLFASMLVVGFVHHHSKAEGGSSTDAAVRSNIYANILMSALIFFPLVAQEGSRYGCDQSSSCSGYFDWSIIVYAGTQLVVYFLAYFYMVGLMRSRFESPNRRIGKFISKSGRNCLFFLTFIAPLHIVICLTAQLLDYYLDQTSYVAIGLASGTALALMVYFVAWLTMKQPAGTAVGDASNALGNKLKSGSANGRFKRMSNVSSSQNVDGRNFATNLFG